MSQLQQNLLFHRRRVMKWIVYVDGASSGNPGNSAAAFVVYDSEGKKLLSEAIYLGQSTNNRAEYEALVRAMERANLEGVDEIRVHSDSELVVRQVGGRYRVKDIMLQQYVARVQALKKKFTSFELIHIPRELNKEADKLAQQASRRGADGWP